MIPKSGPGFRERSCSTLLARWSARDERPGPDQRLVNHIRFISVNQPFGPWGSEVSCCRQARLAPWLEASVLILAVLMAAPEARAQTAAPTDFPPLRPSLDNTP